MAAAVDDYDPSAFPPFAVTVDVVVFTLEADALHVLLVQRDEEPFAGEWAIPGGFKTPNETLDQAAARELAEETGVDAAPYLVQFGAYGDPGRDPRMNVVTVAYLAVLRDVDDIMAGSDAADARMWPVSDVLRGHLPLAFDHERIIRDGVDHVRRDLETTGLATAFVANAFTLSELRTVYEAIWGIRLDGANFRRTLVSDRGWVVATGRHAAPGSVGGKPPELFRAGRAWRRGAPIRRPGRSR
jgi:8-oxo-dGTP diphosphatase